MDPNSQTGLSALPAATPSSEEILGGLEHFGVRLGLKRIRVLLAAMDNPMLDRPTLLVAGTNGKGSVASMLASILRAGGYREGLFTSPHLEQVYERLRLGGKIIAEPDLARLLAEVVNRSTALGCEPPTYFEALTLSAFLHFQRNAVDAAVLEVGLGGRLDATNVSEPCVSVITSIGMDHEKQLGNTPAAIAGEKAGILRPGRPAVVWAELPEVEEVLRQRAEELGAQLVEARHKVKLEPLPEAAGATAQRARIHLSDRSLEISLPLPGHHQLRNAAVAILAAQELREQGFARLDDAALVDGLQACRWPGRLERVTLPEGGEVLLDAAHNPPGAAALAHYLRARKQRIWLLFGVLRKKKVESVLPPLAALSRGVVLTQPTGDRGADPSDYSALLDDQLDERDVLLQHEPSAALLSAVQKARAEGCTLVVSGSLHLVGEIRSLMRQHFGVPAAP